MNVKLHTLFFRFIKGENCDGKKKELLNHH